MSQPIQRRQRESCGRSFVAALAILSAYTVWFFGQTLPNNPELTRIDILKSIPDQLMELVLPTGKAPLGNSWSNLEQRSSAFRTGLAITLSALAIGRILIRVSGLERQLRRSALWAISGGLGFSIISLATLLIGLTGQLNRLSSNALIYGPIIFGVSLLIRDCVLQSNSPSARPDIPLPRKAADVSNSERVRWLALMAPFAVCLILAASLPPVDFDVREYHLQGPKEFYLQGHIGWLAHNAYTSFPFLTEMISLQAMVQSGDWFTGAIAGQIALMTFGLLTTIAVYAAASELGGERAGWFGSLIHLSTPWTYRISTIAYAEGGLTMYVSLVILWLILISRGQVTISSRSILMLGFLAGCGMACKYPGLLSTVAIGGAGVVILSRNTNHPTQNSNGHNRKDRLRLATLFVFGVFLAVGPWLVKNLQETGNPVYPLAYTIFGGADWTPELNDKWREAHSPPGYSWKQFFQSIADVGVRSDWISPLALGLALVSFLRNRSREQILLWITVLWLVANWWLLTHRIDRFWIPLLPVLSILAGLGATWTTGTGWTRAITVYVYLGLAFNLGFITSPLCGNNQYLAEYEQLNRVIETPGIRRLNYLLPEGSRVLCVGEAEVFNARFELLYNTVFDRCILEEWMRDPESSGLESDRPARVRFLEPKSIREKFQDNGITHIYVNWAEILRYRTTYGYTDFAHPEVFGWLVTYGLVDTGQVIGLSSAESLSDSERIELETWGRDLQRDEKQEWITAELYRVR